MSLGLLEIVDIAGTYITGRDIENLSRSIVKLDASKCKKIVSITEKFKEFNHLQYLDFSKTSLEASAIANFPDSLEVIDLAKSKIKGSVEYLGGAIREVNLDETDVTVMSFPNAQKELELLSLVMCSEVDKEKFVKTFSKKGDYIALKCLGIGRQQYQRTVYVEEKERKKIEKAHRHISYESNEWHAIKHLHHESRKNMGRCSLHYKNPWESK